MSKIIEGAQRHNYEIVLGPELNNLSFNELVTKQLTELPNAYSYLDFINFQNVDDLPPLVRSNLYQESGQLKLIPEYKAKALKINDKELIYLSQGTQGSFIVNEFNDDLIIKSTWFSNPKPGLMIKNWRSAPSGRYLSSADTWHAKLLKPKINTVLMNAIAAPKQKIKDINWLTHVSPEEQIRIDYMEHLRKEIGRKSTEKLAGEKIEISKMGVAAKIFSVIMRSSFK